MGHPLLAIVSLFSSSSQITLLSRVVSIFSFSFTHPHHSKIYFQHSYSNCVYQGHQWLLYNYIQRPIFSPHLGWWFLLGTFLLIFPRGQLARSGGIFVMTWGGATCMCWAEARDTAKYPTRHRTASISVIRPKMSVMSRLRNPRLQNQKQYSFL